MPDLKFEITGLTAVTAKLKDVNRFLESTEPMQDLCDDIRDRVNDRTGKGLDYMSRPFVPYSKAYAKKKGSGRPNLRVTGEMLNDITSKAISNKQGEVAIQGRRALVAWYHNEGGPKKDRPPKREFMNISDTQLKAAVKKRFDDPLMKILGRK